MGLSKDSFKRLAKLAVTAVLSPGSLIASAAKEGVDVVADLLYPAERKGAEALVQKVKKDLQALAKSEGWTDDPEPLLAIAGNVLAKGGMTEDELHDPALDVKEAAARVWSRVPEEHGGLSDGEKALVVKILEATYESLLSDPRQLEALERAFRRSVLERLDDLANQPERIVGALRAAAVESVVVPGHRSWIPGDPPPSALLRAEYEVVPFRGRGAELEDLEAWCDAPAGKGIRLYTAEGGMGKTRLMLEACRRRRRGGWHAGFLGDSGAVGDGTSLTPPVLRALFEGDRRPLFLVIDYAERRIEDLERILEVLGSVHRQQPVRIVLLARNADKSGGWWRDLWVRSELLQGSSDEPIRLQPLVMDEAERAAAFREAARSLAHRVGRLGLADDPDPEAPVPDLTGPIFDRALFLHLAALAAASRDAPRLTPDALLDYLLAREEKHWNRRAEAVGLDLSADSLRQTAVLLTLAGPLAAKNATVEVLKRVPALESQTADRLGRLADLFHSLYPARTWLHGVQPDLLGERLVETATTHDPDLLPAALAPEVTESRKTAALTILTRIARRRHGEALTPEARQEILDRLAAVLRLDRPGLVAPAIQAAQQTGDLMGAALVAVLEDGLDGEEARRIEPLLPETTTALREVALFVTRIAVESLSEATEEDQRKQRARLLNNLSFRLSALGRREEALEVIKESVDVIRELSSSRPESFLPDLAVSLNNLSNHLSDLGRQESALEVIKESVTIGRELSSSRPEAFLPVLGMSLNSLSRCLSESGRPKSALEAIEEAVGVYRELSSSRPEAFLADLASSLNNLSMSLSELGRIEEALEAIEESVGVYRELSSSRPEAFLPNLAGSLNTLSRCLSDSGHHEEALEVVEESVGVYRELSSSRPAAFLPGLALSLNSLSLRLSDVRGREEEALKAIEESVAIRRNLSSSRPEVFLPALALSLSNLSKSLSELGCWEEALEAIEESVCVYRDLSSSRPDAFLPALATSLNNLSVHLSELRRGEEALEVIEESVAIRRDLSSSYPEAYLPALAMSLNTLSRCLSGLSRPEEALAATEEAVRVLTPFFEALPAAFGDWMRKMVANYRKRLAELERDPDPELLAPILPLLQDLAGPEEGRSPAE